MATEEKYFGTDGIRGQVGQFPITADFILKLGWAVGAGLTAQQAPAKALIGKDTRISGYMIESALEAGLTAAGVNVFLVGPMPTAAIAYLTRVLRADIGIVISASHNAFSDNGIKFFSPQGFKLDKKLEQEIEKRLSQEIKTSASVDLGKVQRLEDAASRYIEYCKSAVPHYTRLDHLKIVLDCANGATYHTAPKVFSELGANVIEIHSQPDGLNINEACGSMHPESLRERVLLEKADLGIALDGDGDRLVLVDHLGEVLGGDEILYVITKGLLQNHLLSGGIIGTYMSNMGLEVAIEALDLPFARVPVGDQNVIAGLLERGWLLGGEPSGHVIYLPTTTTADGIISALQVMYAMISLGQSLHDIKKGIQQFPQQTLSLPHNGHMLDLNNKKLQSIINDCEKQLGKHGRVFLRYSGTEPVLRMMIEGENEQVVKQEANKLNEFIREMLEV